MSGPSERDRRLAAVWFADIVGYTTLSSQDEDGALEVVGTFQRLAEEIVAQHSGRVVKYIGDAALAEFASTDGAIRSALALMERFTAHDAARRYNSTLRIGVNVGEVITASDGDIYGDGVNLASRLQNQAPPGQVIASEAVRAQIRQRTVFRTEPLGQRTVKGISDPVALYRVTLQDLAVEGVGAPGKGEARAASQPAIRGRSKAPKIVGALVVLAALVAALVIVDPGGVVSRLVPGASVDVAGVTYPSVQGGMAVGADIRVAFTGALDSATANSRSIRLLDADGDPVAAEVSLGAGRDTVEVHPGVPLAYGSTYTLALGEALRDRRGRPVRGAGDTEAGAAIPIHTQPVPDSMPPATARIAAAGSVPPGGPVAIELTEAVEPRSVSGGHVRLTGAGGDTLEAAVQVSEDRRTLHLAPAEGLARGGRYVVHLDSAVRTARGLPVVPDTLSFRVASASGPSAPSEGKPRQGSAGAGASAARTPRPKPAAPATGPATLNLTVASEAAAPFLKVVLDGDTLGPPPIKGRQLTEGRSHVVTIVGVPDLSAYTLVVYRKEITPQPGQVLDVSAEITAFGSIDVASVPTGTVYVDGHQVGRTPLAGYPVTAGVVHRLEIRPSPADTDRVGPFLGEFRVGPLEWKSLGRLPLPPRGGKEGRS